MLPNIRQPNIRQDIRPNISADRAIGPTLHQSSPPSVPSVRQAFVSCGRHLRIPFPLRAFYERGEKMTFLLARALRFAPDVSLPSSHPFVSPGLYEGTNAGRSTRRPSSRLILIFIAAEEGRGER